MGAPVPGRPYVGVEIPNKNSRLVTLREILESKEYEAARRKSKLALALGRDVAGLVRVGDLAKMPHVLIAGATGSGKSVMVNTIIASFLTQATPDDVRMLMVDPKMVELSMYNGIPHLLSPVVTEVDKVVPLLKNAISEMERRYRRFSELGVRNLDGYRKMRLEKFAKGDTSLNNLPSIVIIIDELADLMMAAPEEVEGMICRLAQLARATGIHLVIATQRPSVDVITGLIKANIPTRISFMVSSAVDSRTIIDMGGAERLLGRGDMLYLPADAGRPERIQAAFLADEEAQALVDFWQQQATEFASATVKDVADPNAATYPAVEPGWEIKDEPEDEFELNDDLLDKAEEIVLQEGKASISFLQRRLRVGYSRAARLIDLLEERGIIGQDAGGGRGREILDGSRRNNGYEQYAGDGDEHSLASAADEIVEEERQRNEFLRQQAAMRSRQSQRRRPHEAEEE
jgi:DNA segregation ATPase FtsK/SpoIIIE-like protein